MCWQKGARVADQAQEWPERPFDMGLGVAGGSGGFGLLSHHAMSHGLDYLHVHGQGTSGDMLCPAGLRHKLLSSRFPPACLLFCLM